MENGFEPTELTQDLAASLAIARLGGTTKNHVKFGPREMKVEFSSDHGEQRGDCYLRKFRDGQHYTMAPPELEDRLVEMRYRAGEQVGIARTTRGQVTLWNVRRLPPIAVMPAPETRSAERKIVSNPGFPESKYATPPVGQPVAQVSAPQPAADLIEKAESLEGPVIEDPPAPVVAVQPAPADLPVPKKPVEVERAPFFEVLGRLIADPSIDPGRIAQFMELQERAEAREAEKLFIAALNRLQPRLPRIDKTGRISFESRRAGAAGQNTPYATYEDIDLKIRPLLINEGFSISFGTVPTDRDSIIVITATLSHVGGHSRTESMPLPPDPTGNKNPVQAIGSSLTYGKRYLLCAMLNIVTVGEDTDGNPPRATETIDAGQIREIEQMYVRCNMDAGSKEKFLRMMQVSELPHIRKTQFSRAMNALNTKARKVAV